MSPSTRPGVSTNVSRLNFFCLELEISADRRADAYILPDTVDNRKDMCFTPWLCACIGGSFQYGYNVSIINAPTQSLTLLWSSIVSIFTLGGFFGVCIGGTLSVKLGRKGSLLVNNVFAIVAALLMGLSYPHRAPLYLGEIAPTALRGTTLMGTSVFITGGILTGQVIGLKELLGEEQYWPILLSTTCIPALLQLLSLPFFPESPRYLLIDRGDEVGCKKALMWLNGSDNFEKEREDMESERIEAIGIEAKKPWELFKDRSLRWQLVTIFVINSAQQLNGINAIYFYAAYVFRQCGIPADKIPYATGMLIDRLGRKVLIISGYGLMCVCCLCFTLALTFQDASPVFPYISMACIFAFILCFGLGPGGVTNILNTELFTQTTRSAAYTICGMVGWLSFFTISMVFPFIVYSFLVFLVVCCGVGTYIFLIVPETKGKTFLEIHEEFQSQDKRP
ncbi:hypothetical protein CRUP_007416, partial [Coryphaenoides rupestris]